MRSRDLDDFTARVQKLRDFGSGSVSVHDWFPTDGNEPYRRAELYVCSDALGQEMLELAEAVQGYMTVYTEGRPVPELRVSISRYLTDEEIAARQMAAGATVSFAVDLEAA